jgi:hypothetical protein
LLTENGTADWFIELWRAYLQNDQRTNQTMKLLRTLLLVYSIYRLQGISFVRALVFFLPLSPFHVRVLFCFFFRFSFGYFSFDSFLFFPISIYFLCHILLFTNFSFFIYFFLFSKPRFYIFHDFFFFHLVLKSVTFLFFYFFN